MSVARALQVGANCSTVLRYVCADSFLDVLKASAVFMLLINVLILKL